MKTLADLKRDLKVGSTLILIDAPKMPSHKYLNKTRYIVKTQGNGVYLAENPASKSGSFLDLPKASLVEYDGMTIKVYEAGYRELTPEERSIRANQPSSRPENRKQMEVDALSDGSTMFYRDEAYYRENNATYLTVYHNGPKKYDSNRDMIYDESIKGELSLVYQVLPF